MFSHLKECQNSIPDSKTCNFCNYACSSKNIFIRHTMRCMPQYGAGRFDRLPKLPLNSPFKLSRRAFKSFLQQYELYPNEQIQDAIDFFTIHANDIRVLFNLLIEKIVSFKVQFSLACSFRKDIEDKTTYTLGYFISENFIITRTRNIEEILETVREEFNEKIANFESLGSGWVLDECDRLDIRVGVYNPLSGGCHIELPQKLKRKKAIINIECNDMKCFLWSICAALYSIGKSKKISRLKQYKKYENNFSFDGIK